MSEVWRGPPIAANLGRKQPMIVTMPADSFTLRVSTPDDAAGVSSLLDASYSVLMATGYDAATLTAALPFMTKANPVLLSSGLYYIAEHDDGRLAGCGGWSLEPPGTGEIVDGLGHIRHLAVHPQSTGCGVGRAIKERCEATARAAGVARFKWYASLNAEGFYKALGFTTRGTVDTPKERVGDSQPADDPGNWRRLRRNVTSSTLPLPKIHDTVVHMLAAAAADAPNHVAVIEGARTLTYAEFARCVGRLAQELVSAGGRGQRVALVLLTRWRWRWRPMRYMPPGRRRCRSTRSTRNVNLGTSCVMPPRTLPFLIPRSRTQSLV